VLLNNTVEIQNCGGSIDIGEQEISQTASDSAQDRSIIVMDSLPAVCMAHDFHIDGEVKSRRGPVAEFAALHGHFVSVWLVGLSCCAFVYATISDLGLSTLLTASAWLHCMGLSCLLSSILGRRSVLGISGASVQLQALSFVLRLSSTSWLRGYTPTDATGEWMYQVIDIVALATCLCLLYLIYVQYAALYNAKNDTAPVGKALLGCLVLGVLIHPDLNNRPFWDAVWASSMYMDIVAMLPQILMMQRAKTARVDALGTSYVALVAASRIVSLVFWYHAYDELAPEDAFNVAGYTVMVAHGFQVLAMVDFLYLYMRALLRWGFHADAADLLLV